MLVLARRPGQRIRIGDDIIITLISGRDSCGNTRIGIDAPKDTLVLREELTGQTIKRAREQPVTRPATTMGRPKS